MIRVLLVDDQALLRLAFRITLETEPDIEVVGEAADGDAAVRTAATTDPDVVLMDVRMPGTDGITATSRILRERARTRVLILTTYDLDEYVYAGLRAGASGFLLKDVHAADLVTAVRTVAAGDAVLAPGATRLLLERFAPHLPDHAGRKQATQLLAQLTEREREVLAALTRGLSNREIAGELHLSEGTVKVHVAHILTKLGLRDRVQAVVFAYESGFTAPGGGPT